MAKSLQTWMNVLGTVLKIDDDSADCVDVPKSWITYLTDKGWQEVAGWGNAKDIYYYWSTTYLDRIARGNAPQVGDIVCMDGTVGAGFGHTGVVVAVNGNNITIYQQNTFTQQPVYIGTYNAYSSYIIGFLRPNANAPFTVGDDTPLQGFQREAAYEAKYRDAANSAGTLLQTFSTGETYDFKGFVHGESVDGNDIWFVGRYSGGYVWSGAFTDTGTHDLPDITPATTPALQGFQRTVGNSVINYRHLPLVQPDNVIQTFAPGEVLDFDAWTHGTLVDGSDIWLRGKYSGGWAHSGGFTDTGTHDLTEVTLGVSVTPVPVDMSNRVVDISSNNKVDYAALKAAVRGVVVKAGHTGKSYGGVQPLNSDPNFAVAKTELAAKLVAAYWYGYASLDPEVEAEAFVKTVGAVPVTFTYYLDIEELDGQTVLQVNAWSQKFLNKVDALTNKVTGLYMNKDWFDTKIDATTKGSRPIWLAHYDEAENLNEVTNQVAHQFTSQGTVPGVEGYADINAVTDAFFTATIIVPPTVPVDPTDPTPVEPTPTPEPTYDVNLLVKIFNAIVAFVMGLFNKNK